MPSMQYFLLCQHDNVLVRSPYKQFAMYVHIPVVQSIKSIALRSLFTVLCTACSHLGMTMCWSEAACLPPPLTDHLLPMLANDTRWVLRSWHMCCSPALSLHWRVIQSFCLTLTHVCSQALSLVKSGSAESYKATMTDNWWVIQSSPMSWNKYIYMSFTCVVFQKTSIVPALTLNSFWCLGFVNHIFSEQIQFWSDCM